MASVHGWPETPAQISYLRQNGIGVSERWFKPQTRAKRVGYALWRLLRPGSNSPTSQDVEWQKIRDFRPNLVCISQGGIYDGLEWMERCYKNAYPYVIIAHANNDRYLPSNDDSVRLATVYKKALKCCFVSMANLKLFEKQTAQRLTNACIVRNPFSVPYYTDIPWPEADVLKLACVGRLSVDKGQDLIMEALSLPQWKNRSVSVTFFGDGSQSVLFRNLAEFFGVEDKVVFAGHVHDIMEIWAQHHALILPSRWEGLPIAIVEAMLCGRAVITTDIAGNTEVVEDGVTGFVAQAPKLQLVAEAMERAWQSRGRLKEMGVRAAMEIRSKVSADPVADFTDMLLSTKLSTYRIER